MITLALDTNFRQLKDMSTADIIDRIITVYYPQLSILVNYVNVSISELNENNSAAERAIVTKIWQELNGMIAKEQMILFPLLIMLEKENRKSDCSPFKLVKKNYQSLLSSLQSLKYLLQTGTMPNKITLEVIKQLNGLELNIVDLQRAKEKYLFDRFKSCNNDCQIPAYVIPK